MPLVKGVPAGPVRYTSRCVCCCCYEGLTHCCFISVALQSTVTQVRSAFSDAGAPYKQQYISNDTLETRATAFRKIVIAGMDPECPWSSMQYELDESCVVKRG